MSYRTLIANTPCSNSCYPSFPPLLGGVDAGIQTQNIRQSIYPNSSINPSLSLVKLKSNYISKTPADTSYLKESIIQKRFLQYQRIPPEIPPPLTLAEQIAQNAGRPVAPPGPCVHIVNLLQTLPI